MAFQICGAAWLKVWQHIRICRVECNTVLFHVHLAGSSTYHVAVWLLLLLLLKCQVLTKEYYALQTSMEKRVAELETVVTEKSVKLETYEKLEHELDEVIMQAADGKFLLLDDILINHTSGTQTFSAKGN